MSCNTRVIRSNVIQFELIGLFIKTKVAEEEETIRILEFEKELELLESKESDQIGYYRKCILSFHKLQITTKLGHFSIIWLMI